MGTGTPGAASPQPLLTPQAPLSFVSGSRRLPNFPSTFLDVLFYPPFGRWRHWRNPGDTGFIFYAAEA